MFFLSMMVKLIWSNSLNQINLIIYTAKFDTFLFDQFSLIKFWKNRTCSISSNQFDEIESIKIKIPKCEEKITKIKVQMNEHEISFHVNNSWRLQIVQPEIKTWKDKESLCNVMCKIYKNRDAKKQVSQDCLNYLRWVVIISTFFYYLLISLFVTMDSISLILKENTRFFYKQHFCKQR